MTAYDIWKRNPESEWHVSQYIDPLAVSLEVAAPTWLLACYLATEKALRCGSLQAYLQAGSALASDRMLSSVPLCFKRWKVKLFLAKISYLD